MHIAITGNIGAGKTTLTSMLAKEFNWVPKFEDVDENPYLDDFYKDMNKWSFALQIYFLGSRIKHIQDIQKSADNIIQDRTIYEDAYIFAKNLEEMGYLTQRDFQNYYSIFKLMKYYVPAPDLLIYLKSSVPSLVKKIQKRGRDYETSISQDYLKNLNEKYEKWIENYKEGKLLVIEVDNLDFVEKESDFQFILNKIKSELKDCK